MLPEDLIEYGLIPEFIGRLPVVAAIHQLSRDDLITILTEPRNALTRQFQRFFEFDDIELQFQEDSLGAIADKALERETGARGLRSILEETLMDVQFELPSRRDVSKCVVTKETIEQGLRPTLVTQAVPAEAAGGARRRARGVRVAPETARRNPPVARVLIRRVVRRGRDRVFGRRRGVAALGLVCVLGAGVLGRPASRRRSSCGSRPGTTTQPTAATPARALCERPSWRRTRIRRRRGPAAPGIVYALSLAGAEDAGVAGDLDVPGPLQVVATGRGRATIDGAGLDRVFDLRAPATLEGLRITGGRARGAAGSEGAGVRVVDGRFSCATPRSSPTPVPKARSSCLATTG